MINLHEWNNYWKEYDWFQRWLHCQYPRQDYEGLKGKRDESAERHRVRYTCPGSETAEKATRIKYIFHPYLGCSKAAPLISTLTPASDQKKTGTGLSYDQTILRPQWSQRADKDWPKAELPLCYYHQGAEPGGKEEIWGWGGLHQEICKI